MISLPIALIAFVSATGPAATDAVGDTYELRLTETTARVSGRSSGNSRSNYVLIERVVDVYAGGVELEFDLPPDTTAEERAREWQFPVRVAKAGDGPFELLNVEEINARIDDWLRLSGITREACNQWFFTWTAMRVECDPLSVLQTLRPFDLGRSHLVEGSTYIDPRASKPAVVEAVLDENGLTALVARMQIDPRAVREAEAEQNRVTAEIMGTIVRDEGDDAGLANVEGTIVTTFLTDPTGNSVRRERDEVITVVTTDGVTERRMTTQVVRKEALPR